MTAHPYVVGQILRLRDGEVSIDRITDEQVYFVAWRHGEEVGAPTRMTHETFAAAVAAQSTETTR